MRRVAVVGDRAARLLVADASLHCGQQPSNFLVGRGVLPSNRARVPTHVPCLPTALCPLTLTLPLVPAREAKQRVPHFLLALDDPLEAQVGRAVHGHA